MHCGTLLHCVMVYAAENAREQFTHCLSFVVVGGTVTSCAGISAEFVCTSSSKQICPVSILSDFLAGEVSNHLGLSPDSLSMFFAVHP